MNLLSKSRKINALLQQSAGKSVNFKEMAETLSEIIGATIYINNLNGELTGYAVNQKIENERLQQYLEDRQFPDEYTNHLSNIRETLLNLDVNNELTAFPVENKDLFENGLTTIVPINGGGERLGTLILARVDQPFGNDDLILGRIRCYRHRYGNAPCKICRN